VLVECSQSAADCAAAIAVGRPALPVQRMIVYVHSYPLLEKLVVHLKSNPQTTHIINDEFSRAYSAAMNKADRDHLIRLTLNGNVVCLTATIAASMGVDVDARIVVVIGFDGSPELMRQMAGRLTRTAGGGRGALFVSACSSQMRKLRDECSDIVTQSKSELAPELLAYFVELKKHVLGACAYFDALASGSLLSDPCFAKLFLEPFGVLADQPCTCAIKPPEMTTTSFDAATIDLFNKLIKKRNLARVSEQFSGSPDEYLADDLVMHVARVNVRESRSPSTYRVPTEGTWGASFLAGRMANVVAAVVADEMRNTSV